MLTSVEGWDFCSYAHFKLALAGQGLVQVTGLNGHGKSNLLKAIMWCLYGHTLDEDVGGAGDKVIRHGQKAARVEVALENGGTWIVRRERRKGTPKLELENANGPWDGNKDEIQAKIVELMGLDFRGFVNVVMYGQGSQSRFANPRTDDKDRKAILHRILGTEVLGQCHAWVLEQAKGLRDTLKTLRAELDKVNAQMGEHDVEALQASHDEWETERRTKLGTLKKRAEDKKAEAQRHKDAAGAVEELQREAADLEGTVALTEDAETAAEQHASKAKEHAATVQRHQKMADVYQNTINKARGDLKALAAAECPLCTSPLTTGKGAAHKKEVESAAAVAKRELEKVQKARDAAAALQKEAEDAERLERARARDGKAALRQLATVRERIARASGADALADACIQAALKAVEDMRALKGEANPYAAQLEEAREKVAGFQERVTELDGQITGAEEELAHFQFWATGFGGQGLPSYVLDRAMAPLTDAANRYLEIMADGDITVGISTQRELSSKKGEMRDEINVSHVIRGIPDYAPSFSQQKRIDIATDLALMDLAAAGTAGAMDILFFDEMLDGLDPDGRAHILDLLQHLRTVRSSVFVISHETDVSEIFERAVHVSMDEDGVSSVEVLS